MKFQQAIITQAGLEMLAAANINDKIVFSKFMFEGANVALNALSTSLTSPWGRGHVDNYTSDHENLVIYASASNQYDSGYAYGFGIYAYLASEGQAGEKLIFVANHDQEATFITLSPSVPTKFQIALTVEYSVDGNAVEISPLYNGYVSADLFQRWSERVVTTHADGDEETGDDQIILGDKHIRDKMILEGPNAEIVCDIESQAVLTRFGYDNDYESTSLSRFSRRGTNETGAMLRLPSAGGEVCIDAYRAGSSNNVSSVVVSELTGITLSTGESADYPESKLNLKDSTIELHGVCRTYGEVAFIDNSYAYFRSALEETNLDSQLVTIVKDEDGIPTMEVLPDMVCVNASILPGGEKPLNIGSNNNPVQRLYADNIKADDISIENNIGCQGKITAGVVVAMSVQTTNFSVDNISTGTLMFDELASPLPHAVMASAEVEGVWKTVDIPVGCITLAAFYIPTSIRRVGQQFTVSESAANDTTPNTGICTASLPYKHSSASRLRVLSRGKLGAGRYITMSEPIEDDDTYGMDNTTKVMVVLVQRIA